MTEQFESSSSPLPPPVIPNLTAIPVASLAYSTPQESRPGIITAIGVLSIVIAAIGLLTNLSQIAQAVIFGAVFPRMSTSTTTTTVTSSSSTVTSMTVIAGSTATTLPVATTGPSGLTPQQVQAVIAQVQTASSNGLDAGQAAALTNELQIGTSPIVSPQFAWSPVASVNKEADGTMQINFNSGWTTTIAPNGASLQSSNSPRLSFKINPVATAGVAVVGLLNFALYLLLLVAGIRVFARSPSALRQHRFFARIKLPLAVVGAVALGWFYSGLFSTLGSTGLFGTSGRSMILAGYACWFAFVGGAYPLALLIALRSNQVKAYANTLRV